MKQGKLWLIVAAIIAVALGAGVRLASTPRIVGPKPAANAYPRLLAVTLPDSQGELQPLAQWKGKVLVINFWASWCPPCREEMPALSRLQIKHAANGIQIIGIALDNAANVVQYAKWHPTSYPLLVGDSTTTELNRAMGNSQMALPYTVVYDAAGTARMTRLGLFSEDELDSVLISLTAK